VKEKTAAPVLSVIIPVLHLKRPVNAKRFFMPRYTIREVLRDLHQNVTLPFEVIVICNGNDPELIEFVRTHDGIDKYCLNSVNAGVARSWNMGAAGDYPVYFSPLDVKQMADSIVASAAQGRREPHHESRFHRKAVTALFLKTMDGILSAELGHA